MKTEKKTEIVQNEERFLRHAGKDLHGVMRDTFSQYPEESFYFLDEKKLKKTAIIFQENFLPDDERRTIAYAVKANPHPEVLRILSEVGIDEFDCASEGEIGVVSEENEAAEMLFNNPHKKRKEIRRASEMGVNHYTADFKGEVDKILQEVGELNPEIAIRLKTLNSEGAMINLSEKFGASDEMAKELLRYVAEHNAQPCISMNVGSQVIDLTSYEKNLERLRGVISGSVGKVLAINLGGGMPVLLENSHQENDVLLVQYLQRISHVVREGVASVLCDTENAKIIIEPGRSMVASSVDLAMSIISVQERRQRALTIDDGVFSSFSDSAIHKWRYKMNGINSRGELIGGEEQDYTLYGRTCDSGDVIHGQSLTKKLTDQDYIHVPNGGAYLSSQATEFNSYPVHRYVIYNS